jgi:hypothetical protein
MSRKNDLKSMPVAVKIYPKAHTRKPHPTHEAREKVLRSLSATDPSPPGYVDLVLPGDGLLSDLVYGPGLLVDDVTVHGSEDDDTPTDPKPSKPTDQ